MKCLSVVEISFHAAQPPKREEVELCSLSTTQRANDLFSLFFSFKLQKEAALYSSEALGLVLMVRKTSLKSCQPGASPVGHRIASVGRTRSRGFKTRTSPCSNPACWNLGKLCEKNSLAALDWIRKRQFFYVQNNYTLEVSEKFGGENATTIRHLAWRSSP